MSSDSSIFVGSVVIVMGVVISDVPGVPGGPPASTVIAAVPAVPAAGEFLS